MDGTERPDEEMTVIITETVSDALDAPVEDLPPLSDAVDLEALETLVTSGGDGPFDGVTVTFRYSGLSVFVHSGKTVYVRPARDDGYGLLQPGAT